MPHMIKLAAVVVLLAGASLSARCQSVNTFLSAGHKDTILVISPTAPLPGIKPDTVPRIDWQHAASVKPGFPYQYFILPRAMIAYEVVTLKTNGLLKNFNSNVKDEIWTDGPHKQIHADNYLM